MRQDLDVRRPSTAEAPRGAGRGSRRFRRNVKGGVAAAVLVPVAAIAVLWPLAPSVGAAEQRIAARLSSHGAKDPAALPRPDKAGVAVEGHGPLGVPVSGGALSRRQPDTASSR